MDPVIKSTSKDGDPAKGVRIVDAARSLFMRYGVKRTSIDDVAREAGIAKGTFYLYFASKEDVFVAVAERFCEGIESEVRLAAEMPQRPLADRIVTILDARIGAVRRLLTKSPHVAELYDSKKTVAAAVVAAHELRMRAFFARYLRAEGIATKGAAEMFEAAAFGALHTGDITETAYKSRLRSIVRTLLAGLEAASR